ncbi:MAG: nitrogen fixation protein [Cyanothece sp. SIO2G6]|nr:nitrogen fixation protein [Cyanothece sp. SIO2G6]
MTVDDANQNGRTAFDCPSSTSDISGSEIFGIVEGTVQEPRVTYLERSRPATPELLVAANPVEPTEIFRFVGSCLETGCQQFDNGQCQLAKRIVQGLPVVTQTLPSCVIRHRCRWWHQEGEAACRRCLQIARTHYAPSAILRRSLTD